MTPIFSNAVSGAQLSAKRMAASAYNVANARSVVPTFDMEEAIGPVRVDAMSSADGGVRGQTRFLSPGYLPAYEPDHPQADAKGLVARADVSLDDEAVRQIQGLRAYQANLEMIRAGDSMLGSLLDFAS
jgi:flagellar basal-body rod protein FlgC